MADTGGINITVTQETATSVAQRLVCWDKVDGQRAQTVQYRTDGNLPYFRIPAGTCAGKGDLKLTPDGTALTCPSSGAPNRLEPPAAQVAGLDPNTCTEIPAPTGLAVSGTPTTTAITVQWSAPSTGPAPTGYQVSYRADGSTGAWTYIQVGAGTLTATATGLTANTAYDFRVQARRHTYLSPPTADITVSTASS